MSHWITYLFGWDTKTELNTVAPESPLSSLSSSSSPPRLLVEIREFKGLKKVDPLTTKQSRIQENDWIQELRLKLKPVFTAMHHGRDDKMTSDNE